MADFTAHEMRPIAEFEGDDALVRQCTREYQDMVKKIAIRGDVGATATMAEIVRKLSKL